MSASICATQGCPDYLRPCWRHSPGNEMPCDGCRRGMPFNFAGAHIAGAYETLNCTRDEMPVRERTGVMSEERTFCDCGDGPGDHTGTCDSIAEMESALRRDLATARAEHEASDRARDAYEERLRGELASARAEIAGWVDMVAVERQRTLEARADVERLTRERDDYFGALKLAREQIEAVTADRRAILAASPAPLPTAPAPAQPPSRKDTRMNTDDIPRRARLDLNTPAELAIRSAMAAVEEAGADPRLTDAVVMLDRARNIVADYVDAAPARAAPEKPPSGFVPYPTGRPPRYNGGRLCDMWVGPCACGAWHQGADDVLERCAREPSTTPGKP